MEVNENEATRLACASAVLHGSLFRQGVIDRARDRYHATAPEIGLDFGLLLLVCSYLEARETQYQWAHFVCLLALFPALVIGPLGPILVVVAIFAIHISKSYVEHFEFLRLFREDTFDPEEVAQCFAMDLDSELVRGVPVDRQNVLIHQGFNPFVGVGGEEGSWSFSLDISRPDLHAGEAAVVKPFDIAELYGAVHAAVKNLAIPNLDIRDCLLVNGSDLKEEAELLPDPFARPNQQISATLLRELRGRPGASQRHYKWVMISDWGDEMVFSYFLRFVASGQTLYIEAIRFLLTPLSSVFRTVDAIPLPNWRDNIGWFIVALFSTLLWFPLSIYALMAKFQRWFKDLFGTEERLQRVRIKCNTKYNYGAVMSLRQAMSGGLYRRFFQRSDKEMYEKTLEREILDAVADFLTSRNVDISEIKERQASILNNGIIVQGGSVQAGALAVGKQAKAGVVKEFMARTRPAAAK